MDTIIKGGLPAGSFTLLLGEVGAGSQEFAYTSMLMLSQMKKERIALETDGKSNGVNLPDKICYISFTRTRDNILLDISALKVASVTDVESNLIFIDLSGEYFSRTQVPMSWTRDEMATLTDLKTANTNRTVFKAVIDTLEKYAPNNLVIIDSLTDLLRSAGSENLTWSDLVSLLKGIQRMSKQWNSVIYALLTADIFDASKEEEVSDCVDGVMVFKWDITGINQLQRTMYIKKFRGLMPYLEEDNVVRFETKVSASRAFEISNIREIIGR
ncbi:hypothetical protein CUJ83_13755 [Methanocella sp. CWC-04]|uniref:RecA-superfamily ATPase, KaiC/GvpD/RAD55 family n=2 Tax=Methanooceanicella nereidis TaxID=2052831 RepID=A0AAP2REV3_9EURY|nr:hypothetical protein [Methanocella sp. CWC-04]